MLDHLTGSVGGFFAEQGLFDPGILIGVVAGAAILGAVLVALLVGFSRVCLGAHYLSDVLGAAAAGLGCLALSLTAVDTLRRSRSRAV